jgi:hypothetical protein
MGSVTGDNAGTAQFDSLLNQCHPVPEHGGRARAPQVPTGSPPSTTRSKSRVPDRRVRSVLRCDVW